MNVFVNVFYLLSSESHQGRSNGLWCPNPRMTSSMSYSTVINDTEATKRIVDSFGLHFPKGCILETRSISTSEDFGTFGTESQTPSVYWIVGGTDQCC